MTYHINVKETNIEEFLQIISSLRSLGVIESVESAKELIREGNPLNTDTLLNILDHSKKEIEKGNSLTSEEVKNQIEIWKKKRK